MGDRVDRVPRSRSAAWSRRVALATGVLGLGAWVGGACSSSEGRYPPLHHSPGTGAGGTDDGFDAGLHDGPPPLDADGLCGNQIHEVVSDAPNIYFVLDNSGSMAAPVEGGGDRYDAVRLAAAGLVRKLGPLINVGAALFPRSATEQNPCHTGGQVMPILKGSPKDPVTGYDGPTTTFFIKVTQSKPEGGTPTSATLEALTPTLIQADGKTIVVLATDGGPNCNEDASCTALDCMPNIEGQCDPSVNCCAPGGAAGPTMCVDRPATVSAIEALADAGIPVYVIGIPGSETYGSVLDDMAIAGGAPQMGSPAYYRVDDLGTLESTFGAIASLVVSCIFDVVDPPDDPGMTNVYLDKQLLPQDPVDGWTWLGDSQIELHGEACARLKNGQVGQVQIVSGCPTEEGK